MSFHRQSSDEADVTRHQQTALSQTTRSNTSQSSRSSTSDVEALDESCALRNLPKHKSQQLRFLTWLAYTRKYTEGITAEERRTCPLLHCRIEFKDQEQMLQHVWECPYLATGPYWCFQCRKPERISNFKCRRCRGLPSKTERMTSVARKIFSKLGAKSHRHEPRHAPAPEPPMALSKKAEAAQVSDSKYCQDLHKHFDGTHPLDGNSPNVQELPNTFVCPEMAGDWTAASHELPDSYISEMTGTEVFFSELGDGAVTTWEDNFYAENLEDWEPSSPRVKPKGSFPKLALDTSFTMHAQTSATTNRNLSQVTQLSNWTDASLSATIISPMSAVGGFNGWSSPLEVSPTDSEASGSSLFTTDSGYSSATTQSSAWGSFAVPIASFNNVEHISGSHRGRVSCYDWNDELNFSSVGIKQSDSMKGKHRAKQFESISENWLIEAPPSRPEALQLAPILTLTENALEWPCGTIHSQSQLSASEKSRRISPHWHDATSLVHSFSEVLDTHITHTRRALKQLPITSMTTELLSMSKGSIESIGLEVLAGILEGRSPTAIVQIFAFMHIACALAIASEYDEARVNTGAWFQDSLCWVQSLTSEKQRCLYFQVVRSVWQPLDILGELTTSSHEMSKPLDGNNALIVACKHFLDVFESFETLTSSGRLISRVVPQQTSYSQIASAVLDELFKKPGIEAFNEIMFNTQTRLSNGQLHTTRELELELMCAGKLVAQSDIAYARFIGHVTTTFDGLYAEDGEMSRTKYHIADIGRIKQVLPEERYGDELNEEDRNERFDDKAKENVSYVDDMRLLDFDFGTPSNETKVAFNISSLDRNIDETSKPQACIQQQPSETRASQEQAVSVPRLSSSKANSSCRCYCGYEPAGEERWKASNLRRHKRTQHAKQANIYSCRFEGCKSTFTRSDNLRSHQREKGHAALVRVDVGSGSSEGEAKRRRTGKR